MHYYLAARHQLGHPPLGDQAEPALGVAAEITDLRRVDIGDADVRAVDDVVSPSRVTGAPERSRSARRSCMAGAYA